MPLYVVETKIQQNINVVVEARNTEEAKQIAVTQGEETNRWHEQTCNVRLMDAYELQQRRDRANPNYGQIGQAMGVQAVQEAVDPHEQDVGQPIAG
jgi:hypothetical protein